MLKLPGAGHPAGADRRDGGVGHAFRGLRAKRRETDVVRPRAGGNCAFYLQPLRSLPATNRLNLGIGLPLRNQEELTRLLAEIYDPASTNYQHYLTPEQFAARFGPTEQDYQSLINFAKTNGLTVTATYPNRALLDVSGSAATVEKVFHVKLNVYQHPTENRTFYAPDTEPSINLALPILHVSGLDNYSPPRPALKKNYPADKPAGVAPAWAVPGRAAVFWEWISGPPMPRA